MKIFNPALLSAGNFFGIGAILIFIAVLIWAAGMLIGGNSTAPVSGSGNS